MVGADLANICNESALLAARRNRALIGMQEFEDAIDRIMMGAQRPLLLSQEERNIIAYHEGGHALVALLTPAPTASAKSLSCRAARRWALPSSCLWTIGTTTRAITCSTASR